MHRIIALLIVCIALSAATGATWIALQPPIESLIIPGAVDVQIAATGWGQRQITYHAPGLPFAWYYATAHRLEVRGWIALDARRPTGTGSVYTPIAPLRFQQLYVLIQDQVALLPNTRSPNHARIEIRRQIVLRWRYRS
jgi:hypothetical protein